MEMKIDPRETPEARDARYRAQRAYLDRVVGLTWPIGHPVRLKVDLEGTEYPNNWSWERVTVEKGTWLKIKSRHPSGLLVLELRDQEGPDGAYDLQVIAWPEQLEEETMPKGFTPEAVDVTNAEELVPILQNIDTALKNAVEYLDDCLQSAVDREYPPASDFARIKAAIEVAQDLIPVEIYQ